MIQHLILFKLREFENEDQKAVVRSKIKKALYSLKEKIGAIRYIYVGENYELITSSFDICLITHFESLNDLEIYHVNTEWLKVAELIKANTSGQAVIDFEF